MTHSDDLALVTACRDALAKATPGPWRYWNDGFVGTGGDRSLSVFGPPDRADRVAQPARVQWKPNAVLAAGAPTVYSAALSLIEDTLNRHGPQKPRVTSPRYSLFCRYCVGQSGSASLVVDFPCADYSGALTALRAIATALGVAVDAAVQT